MCEHCGCQDIAVIGELTREHAAVINLIADARIADQCGDIAALAEIARRIAAILRPHRQVEEDGLFPTLADHFPGKFADLAAEHRLIEAVLDEARDGVPADPCWSYCLTDALAQLREHILSEEDGVFPAALANLSTEQWKAVEAVRARAGSYQTLT